MNKYISSHIYPYPPVDLTTNTTPKKPKKKKDKNGKVIRKQGTQAPYRLSPALAAVCGKDILPRPQVTQALWVYIRKHGLQDPKDKRQIICDAMFKAVMGGNARVTMFNMAKHITPHLLEKLDKSEYRHEEIEKEEGSTSGGEESSEEDSNSNRLWGWKAERAQCTQSSSSQRDAP